jgi:hypothetical protein
MGTAIALDAISVDKEQEQTSAVVLLDGTGCGNVLAPPQKQARRAGRFSAGRHLRSSTGGASV